MTPLAPLFPHESLSLWRSEDTAPLRLAVGPNGLQLKGDQGLGEAAILIPPERHGLRPSPGLDRMALQDSANLRHRLKQ